ncbi:LacI family DNA-binding transcriptional regulator [Streptomyces sp. TS71-3]|uniref:LacI family DNA-binding transcriptional regulator n=1 Tax=Streptomyces sp. TS71-3 TaxID=2733862 RepID=UPI001B268835|nr:LacI family DNA-binding transcriptional regulator [Streptomyces sp. TS71-3]GHJ41351.1 LacI family transcriptional regulator [Streptomyces sp. TS71-3]
MGKLTIRDIARLSGLSKSTVSLVLNDSPRVDPATRRRVLAVMERHNYVPSFAATALAKGNTRLIGMVVPGLTWRMVAPINYGVASIIEQSKYEMLLYTATNDRGYDGVIDRVLGSGLSAGLLVVTGDHPLAPLEQLHRDGLPTVLINTLAEEVDLPSVEADNFAGGVAAARHLLSLGHRRIACVLGPLRFPGFHERLRGCRDTLAEAGIAPDPKLDVETGMHEELIRGRTAELLELPQAERPTAFFAFNDPAAFIVLDEVAQHGLRVPEDIAVVGFDDIEAASHVRPSLTTVRQPFVEMGKRAARMLLDLVEPAAGTPGGGAAGPPHERVVLPTELIARASTGPSRST